MGVFVKKKHTHIHTHTHSLYDLLLWWVHNSNQSSCLCWLLLRCAPVTIVDGWVSHRGEGSAVLSPLLSSHCRSHWNLWTTLLLPDQNFFSIHRIAVFEMPLAAIQLLLLFHSKFCLSKDCYSLMSDITLIFSLEKQGSNITFISDHWIPPTMKFCLRISFYCNNEKEKPLFTISMYQIWQPVQKPPALNMLLELPSTVYCLLSPQWCLIKSPRKAKLTGLLGWLNVSHMEH